ncbi:hypothetical protein [Nonomuraea sp. NPDC049129]|uniref:hypothetical protein n=1 Tax=unclassified Nonomuraea TaxID=2593643 RepID=UPI0033FB5A20
MPTGPGHGPHAGGERPKSVKADWSETDGTINLDWAIPQWAGLGSDAVLGIILVMALAKAVLITGHLRRRRRSSAGSH